MIKVLDLEFINIMATDGNANPLPAVQGLSPLPSTGLIGELTGSILDPILVRMRVEAKWSIEDIEFDFDISDNSINITNFDPLGSSGVPPQDQITADFADSGFEIGDTVTITDADPANNLVNATIVGLTSKKMTLSPSNPLGLNDLTVAKIFGTTPITSLDYLYNLIENNDVPNDFLSRITGVDENLYTALNVDANDTVTAIPLIPKGVLNWQVSTVQDEPSTVVGDGIVNFAQRFIINHYFYINDLTELDFNGNSQPDSLLLPEYSSTASPKYTFDIRGRTGNVISATDRFVFQDDATEVARVVKSGNVGFFGEVYNGYSQSGATITNLTLTDVSTNAIVTNLLSNGETKVNLTLTGVDPLTFPTTGNDGIVQITLFEKPDSINLTDISKSYLDNINLSRVIFHWNPASSTQVYLGNLIKDTGNPTVSNNQQSLNIEFITHNLNNLSNGEYVLAINLGINDPTLGVNDLLNTSYLLSFGSSIFVLPTGYCAISSQFIQHAGLTGTEDIVGAIEDNILGEFNLIVDKTAISGDTYDIDLQSLEVQVVAKHATDSSRDFLVENKVLNTGVSNYGTSSASFELEPNDPFNEIVWNEEFAQETATQKFYTLKYPIKLRWEDWVQANADSDFQLTDFQDWTQFEQHPDWELVFNLKLNSDLTNQSDGTVTPDTQNKEFDFENLNDYGQTCDINGFTATYTNLTIDILDANTLAPLGLLAQDRKLKIVATFEGDWNLTPFYPFDIYGMLRLDADGVGGVNYNREISTEQDVPSGSEWEGITNPLRADITIDDINAPYPIIVEAIIDGTKLDPSLTQFCVSARIGAIDPITNCISINPNAKLLESGDVKLLENTQTKIIE